MGLPFALDHINLWLLADELDGRRGWTVVDTGIADDATRATWTRLLDEGLDGLPLLRVVVTHLHPDHIGLADWLTRRASTPEHDCRAWVSATDWYAAQVFRQGGVGDGAAAAEQFQRRHGLLDDGARAAMRRHRQGYGSLVPSLPPCFVRLMPGTVLRMGGRDWRLLAGHGHAPEHIALHAEADGLLIAGDMVLPRISTNISVTEYEPEGDPLAAFLASLDRMSELPADTLVLPSHGWPFTGLHTRLDQLRAHHVARLAELEAACGEVARSAVELLPVLFPRALDAQQMPFAFGEAVAHVNHLAAAGRLRRELGADGCWRWRAAQRSGT